MLRGRGREGCQAGNEGQVLWGLVSDNREFGYFGTDECPTLVCVSPGSLWLLS